MKTHSLATFIAIAISALFTGSMPAQTGNAFANGGFEIAGSGASPAQSWLSAAECYTRSTVAFEGMFSLQLSSPQVNAAVALQNSVGDGGQPPLTEGDELVFSFQAMGFAGTTGNVLFSLAYLADDGTILYSSGLQFFQDSINPTTWTQITFTPDPVPVGATTAFLEFSHAIGPINDDDLLAGTVLIDSVNLGAELPGGLLGDVNLDGVVDFFDIAPFIALLSAAEFQTEADIDMDVDVDFFDIAPFIAILSNQ